MEVIFEIEKDNQLVRGFSFVKNKQYHNEEEFLFYTAHRKVKVYQLREKSILEKYIVTIEEIKYPLLDW